MKVNRIVDSNVKSGDTKSGDTWSMSLVELNDGQLVRIFNPVIVGDMVESYQNGKYTNWRIKKITKTEASADIEKLLNSMAKELQTLSGRVEVLEVYKATQEKNVIKTESRVGKSDDFPEDFLKTSFKLEKE